MSRTYDLSAGPTVRFKKPSIVELVERNGEDWVRYRYRGEHGEVEAFWDVAQPSHSNELNFDRATVDGLMADLSRVMRDRAAVRALVETYGPLGIGRLPGPHHPNGVNLGAHWYRPVEREGEWIYAPVNDFFVFALQLASVERIGAALRLQRCDEKDLIVLGVLNPELATLAADLPRTIQQSILRNTFDDWVSRASQAFGWCLDVSVIPGKRPEVRQVAFTMPALAIWGMIARLRHGRNPAVEKVCTRQGCNNTLVGSVDQRRICDQCRTPHREANRLRNQKNRAKKLAQNPAEFRSKDAERKRRSRAAKASS